MDKEKLKGEIEKYLNYYYDVKRAFDLYRYIKENAEIYPNETKQISFFLHTVLISLLNNTLLDVSKILDNRNDKNIYKLLEVCNQNIKLFCEDEKNTKEKNEKLNRIKRIKEKIDFKKDLIEKLKTYRDKSLAHTEGKYFRDVNKLFNEVKTTYEEIEDILEVIEESLNELLYALCNTTYVFNDQYKNDYTYILKCIKEFRENS